MHTPSLVPKILTEKIVYDEMLTLVVTQGSTKYGTVKPVVRNLQSINILYHWLLFCIVSNKIKKSKLNFLMLCCSVTGSSHFKPPLCAVYLM